MEINRQPITRDGEPELDRGDGQDISIWKVRLSDTPSKEWRARFNDLAATDRAVSRLSAQVKDEAVSFEASASILGNRVALIDGWIKVANTEIGF